MTTTSRRRRPDINSATVAELASVPSLNTILARRIVAHRPFKKIKELLHVRGLEPEIYRRVAPRLKVGPPPKQPKSPAALTRKSPPPPVVPLGQEQPPSTSGRIAAEREKIDELSYSSPQTVEDFGPPTQTTEAVEPAAPIVFVPALPAVPLGEEQPPSFGGTTATERETTEELPCAPAQPVEDFGPPTWTTEAAELAAPTAEAAYIRPPQMAERASVPHREAAVVEIVYEPEVIVLEAEPSDAPNACTEIVPAASYAVTTSPYTRFGGMLLDSYVAPRLMFSIFSAAAALVIIGYAAGLFTLGGRAALASPSATPTPQPVIVRMITAAPSSTTPPLPASPTPLQAPPTPTLGFVSNSGLVGAGPQIFNETFDPAGYWNLGESDFSNVVIADNHLTIQMKRLGVVAWTTNGYGGSDFFYQGGVYVGSCQRDDYFGLVFRSHDNSRYLFGLSCGGQYRVIHNLGDKFEDLVGFTFTPYATVGSDTANLLAVRAKGAQLSFYVNDQYLSSIDNADPAAGLFGVFAKSSATGNLRVDFDDMAAWLVNP